MSESLDKLEIVDEFLRHQLWLQDLGEGRRLTGVSIKIRPEGYLVILKAISKEGHLVAFLGKGSLVKLYRCLQSGAGREALVWRPDKYKLA